MKYALKGCNRSLKKILSFFIVFAMAGSMVMYLPNKVQAATTGIVATPTTQTTGTVTVTITYPTDSSIGRKQYSLNGGQTWSSYTAPVSMSANGTVKARYEKITYILFWSYSDWVDLGSITISNIIPRPTEDLNNGDWSNKNLILQNTPEAQLMVRAGDIDNLGFGWRATNGTIINPFEGKETSVHSISWTTPSDEPSGLDRVMVTSGFMFNLPDRGGADGYSTALGNRRTDSNTVKPIVLNYRSSLNNINIQHARLQMFVDDFQAGSLKDATDTNPNQVPVKYKVTIGNSSDTSTWVRIPQIEDVINKLNQSGPRGRLLTIQIPDEYMTLLKSGTVYLKIDDPDSRYGDGYAIDFVKLLINPKDLATGATVTGKVLDEQSRAVANARVSASAGVITALTDANGNYILENVPPGTQIIAASKDGYISDNKRVDAVKGEIYNNINFVLKRIVRPATPIIYASDYAPTSNPVIITVNYPDNPVVKKISYRKDNSGNDIWEDYRSLTISDNNTVIKAKSKLTAVDDNIDNWSDVATYTVTNINRSKPATPILSQDISTPTNQNVNVTIVYPSDAKIKYYSINDGVWQSYTGPIPISTNGTKISAVCYNEAGTASEEDSLIVNNIDREAPTATIDVIETNADGSKVVGFVYKSEPIIITNRTITPSNAGTSTGEDKYTCYANSEVIFYFRDAAGNTGSASCKVTVGTTVPIIPGGNQER